DPTEGDAMISLLIRLLIALCVGLAGAVGIAWRSASLATDGWPSAFPVVSPGPGPEDQTGHVMRTDTRSMTRLYISAPYRFMRCGMSRMDDKTEREYAAYRASLPKWNVLTPAWALPLVEPVLRLPCSESNPFGPTLTIEGHGWPARCLYYTSYTDVLQNPPIRNTLRGVIPVNLSSNTGLIKFRGYGAVLPCLPT